MGHFFPGHKDCVVTRVPCRHVTIVGLLSELYFKGLSLSLPLSLSLSLSLPLSLQRVQPSKSENPQPQGKKRTSSPTVSVFAPQAKRNALVDVTNNVSVTAMMIVSIVRQGHLEIWTPILLLLLTLQCTNQDTSCVRIV